MRKPSLKNGPVKAGDAGPFLVDSNVEALDAQTSDVPLTSKAAVCEDQNLEEATNESVMEHYRASVEQFETVYRRLAK